LAKQPFDAEVIEKTETLHARKILSKRREMIDQVGIGVNIEIEC